MRMAGLPKTIINKWTRAKNNTKKEKLGTREKNWLSQSRRVKEPKRTLNCLQIESNCLNKKSRRLGKRLTKLKRRPNRSCSNESETKKCKSRRKNEWRRSKWMTWCFKKGIIKSDNKSKRELRKVSSDIFKRSRLKLKCWKSRRMKSKNWLKCKSDRKYSKTLLSNKWSRTKNDS